MNLAPLENLRGNYESMASDWTVPQRAADYSDEDQAVWRLLVERQTALAKVHACDEFVQGLETLGIGDSIPDFAAVNARLEKLTGWRVVGVPGLIPDAVFYDHLAHRRFPVTVWIRTRAELDYLVEPDLFHDFFGHVPLLSNPVFADYMQMYGQRALEAGAKIDLLARLYWYTVEFGLIRTPAGPEDLRCGHPLVRRRSEARDRERRRRAPALRGGERHAPALSDRQAAEHLFRARRFPPALRGGADARRLALQQHQPVDRDRHPRLRASPAAD